MNYNVHGFTDPAKKMKGSLFKEYLDLNVLNQLLQDCEQLIISNRQI